MSDELIKRIRDYCDSLAPPIAKRYLNEAAARIATLEQTLREIANADTVEWDDPTEFEAWAKSRARLTLAKGEKA